MNGVQQQFSLEPITVALVGRAGDTWVWLVANGCVGQGLHSSGNWMRVTQRGARRRSARRTWSWTNCLVIPTAGSAV